MTRADAARRSALAACAAILMLTTTWLAVPAADGAGAKRYPAGRAGLLKARLLEEPTAAEAPKWALEYASLPEIRRLDPPTRAAERLWAARVGLAAAGKKAPERKHLLALLAPVENAPIDSILIKRAAWGLTRIGVVVPLSGRYERYGKTFVNGLRLAVDDHNREWSPTLHLILHDSEGDPLIGARKARWLLKDHGVSVIVGELLTANTAPLAAATQVIGAVLLSPSATNERLATLGDGVFQLYVGTGPAAAALVGHLAKERPRGTVGLLVAATAEDSVRALAVSNACRQAGVGIVAVERVPEAGTDATRPIAALRAKKPDALILLAPPKTVAVVAPQIVSGWKGVRLYGFDDLDPEGMPREAREALEGATLFLSDYALAGAPRDSFEVHYRRAYTEAPTRMAVRGYLAGLALTRGIEGGAVTPSMLRQALRAQLYETSEGQVLRMLRPVIPAFAERAVVRGGRTASPSGDGTP